MFEAPSGIPANAPPVSTLPTPSSPFGPDELASWQRGEETGCQAAWRNASVALRRLARGFASSGAAAEELAQDAFARAHRARASLADPTGLVPWTIAIAVRLARNVHRGARRRAVAEAAAARTIKARASCPVEALELAERARATRAAIDLLPPAQREVLVLRHLPLRAVEVALLLGIPLGTVKSRHRAALAALARTLPPPAPARAPETPNTDTAFHAVSPLESP